jgi:hypothetical protein
MVFCCTCSRPVVAHSRRIEPVLLGSAYWGEADSNAAARSCVPLTPSGRGWLKISAAHTAAPPISLVVVSCFDGLS